MEIRPITFKAACEFVSLHHRHHKPTVGCKFCVGPMRTKHSLGALFVVDP